MVRHYEFSFRVNQEELRLISELAARLQRSRSDAIRLLIREAVRELTDVEMASADFSNRNAIAAEGSNERRV